MSRPGPRVSCVRRVSRDLSDPALREDLLLLRTFLRTLHLLDPPGDLMKNPLVVQRVLESYARRDQRERISLGPSRAELLERFCAASAEDRGATA